MIIKFYSVIILAMPLFAVLGCVTHSNEIKEDQDRLTLDRRNNRDMTKENFQAPMANFGARYPVKVVAEKPGIANLQNSCGQFRGDFRDLPIALLDQRDCEISYKIALEISCAEDDPIFKDLNRPMKNLQYTYNVRVINRAGFNSDDKGISMTDLKGIGSFTFELKQSEKLDTILVQIKGHEYEINENRGPFRFVIGKCNEVK